MNEEFTGIVYILRNTINDKKYIGITTRDIVKRMGEHKYDSTYKSRKNKTYLHNSMSKYGFDSFELNIIETIYTKTYDELKETLYQKERFYIDFYDTYNNGYNLTIGGEGCEKVIMSEETRKKISRVHKGKILSDEHKQKISEFMRSDKNPNLHRKLTDKTKEKISKANKGKLNGINNPMYGKQRKDLSERNLEGSYKIFQIDKITNKIIKEWDSLREISRETGWNRSCINDCCKGITRQSHGYLWKYV